jgi:hypothetical protein
LYSFNVVDGVNFSRRKRSFIRTDQLVDAQKAGPARQVGGTPAKKSTYYRAAKEPKTPDRRQQLTKVHRAPAQERIDCVSAGSFELISFQPMPALHMTDRWLNDATLFYQSPQPFWKRF